MNDIPYDVWSLVISFLPDCDVEKLSGVSRQLRPLGLNARFREVRFDRHDSRMKRLSEMLRRDEIAPCVRSLIIEPWLVQPRTKTCVSRSENLWNHINTFFDPKYMEQEAERRVQKRIDKDIKRVTDAVQRLKNINEYQILYDERSPTHHDQFFKAFLSPTLETLGPNLAKLTIKVPFEQLSGLSYVSLLQLRVFAICLCTGEAPMEAVNYALDGFFVFIHNLRNLEHLGISATSSSRNLDLSHFSKRWGTFPRLKSFSLSIPFNGGLLTSPEELYSNVIAPHAGTLEKLKLSTTSCGPRRISPDCIFWIQRILRSSLHTPFPHLREIELALRPLKADLTDLRTFLRSRAPTLEKLCLTDRALDVCELAELFRSLCPLENYPNGQNHVLKSLRIKTVVLSADLLVLIKQRLSRLITVGLTFSDVVGDPKDRMYARYDTRQLASFEHTLRPLSSTVFSNWELCTLDLVEAEPPPSWSHALEQIFRRCFPPTLVASVLPSSTN